MVRETRRAGERGDARAFEYSLVAPAGSQGPPAPLRRRCPPGRCSGGALVAPRRRLRPEGRGLGRGEQRGRERDGARLPNEPHGLRLGRRGHHLGRGGGRDGEVGRGKRQTCRLAPLRRDECVGWPRAGGSGKRRAVGTPTRAARTPPAPPEPATDAVGAARSRALVGRAVRVVQAVLCRPADAPESGPRGLKVRDRSPAVPDACHAGRWPSRPGRGWSEGGGAQEGDGAGKGAVMAVRRGLIGGVERGAKRRL